MIELGPCEITAAFGPMASGKTYLLNKWLHSSHPLANRYVRFDATGETLDDSSVIHVWQSPQALYARLRENPFFFRICYHPGENLESDFRYVLKCLWRLPISKMIVCDEWHEICPVNATPKYVRTALRYARHNQLAILAASQRLADVDKLFTAGCRKVIVYRSDEARDFIAVKDRWGIEAAEAMRNLRPLIYNDSTKVTVQIPQCLVFSRGEKPLVFDFQSDSFSNVKEDDSRRQLSGPEEGDGSSDSGIEETQQDTSSVPEQISSENSGGSPETEPIGEDSGS